VSDSLFALDQSLRPLLEDTFWGFRASRVLQVANEIGVFDRLTSGARTADQIAHACGTHATMTEKLLICCCGMGLLRRDGELFANTQIATTYLVKDAPLYQGHIIGHAMSVWGFWNRLEAVIYGGSRDADAGAVPAKPDDKSHVDFIHGMHDISITGAAQMVALNVDLAGRARLLDVGGGPGTYSIAFCQRNPALSCVVFDRAETLAITRQVVARYGLSARVQTEEGDWNQESYGFAYDAVLLSNVLHGPTSGALDKLRKARAAMNPGGMVIVHDFMLNAEKSGPLQAALFNMMVGTYSVPEMIGVVGEAGFGDVRLVATGDRGNAVVTGVRC